jgi:hypothetical protein
MKSNILFFGLLFLISCTNNEKTGLDDLVEQKADGSQEVKVEQLTIEDVARLEAEAGEQGETFTGMLNNDAEKIYQVKADTNQSITWLLESKYSNAKVFVYKETISSVKKDSSSYMKIKDFKLVCQSDSCHQKNKKQTNYKAVVKLNPKFSTIDSTCEFTLRVIKN